MQKCFISLVTHNISIIGHSWDLYILAFFLKNAAVPFPHTHNFFLLPKSFLQKIPVVLWVTDSHFHHF